MLILNKNARNVRFMLFTKSYYHSKVLDLDEIPWEGVQTQLAYSLLGLDASEGDLIQIQYITMV